MSIAIIFIGLVSGLLIGLFGVGGVLLAPALFFLLEIDLHQATAISSWSFLFTGIVGTWAYWRSGNIDWRAVLWLAIGILPGAILGVWVNSQTSSPILLFLIVALILSSGYRAVFKSSPSKRAILDLDRKILSLLGLAVGFGSALTGTGGPVLLVPALLFLNVNAIVAIAASQVAQIPVAVAAGLGNFLFAEIDFVLGTSLGIVQSIAVLVGARIATSIQAERLERYVGFAMISVGLIILGRLVTS